MITRVCVVVLLLAGADCYSKVAIAGSGPATDDGPKVFKALNMDLIYPKSFNSSENISSTTDASPPVIVESLSANADQQFTPEHSSSDMSSAEEQQPPVVVTAEQEQQPAISENHLTSPPPAFFVTPANHANDESDASEVAAVTSAPPLAAASGRAVDYRPAYPFSQLLTPNSKGYRPSAIESSYPPVRSRPVTRPNPNSSGAVRRVYPSYQASRTPSRAEIDKLTGKGYFSDRFTPSEAVASSAFKRKPNRKPSNARPIGQPSNKVSSFVAPKDLYSFPPNSNSRYPSPSDVRQAAPSDTVTSYLPPPAGPADASKFVGPVNPALLAGNSPPSGGDSKDMGGNDGYHYDPPPMPKDVVQSGYLYEPPKAALDAHLDVPAVPDTPEPMKDSGMMMGDMGMGMDSAPPADDGGMMGMDDDGAPPDDHDHDHDHDDHDHDHHDHDIGGYVDGKEYPTPPPGYEVDHDHDHDHHHSDIDFLHGPYFHDHHHDYDHHHYPDIVYDDYHDHHFHHDHPTMPPMTTEAPPPPPPPVPAAPEMPRVKKYSYFYIGRKLWYIPLYFTVWFTFYVLWLILKSIARHKANLPNHYVSRRSIEEFNQLNHREAREAIDKLTVKVMDGIERFKERFIG